MDYTKLIVSNQKEEPIHEYTIKSKKTFIINGQSAIFIICLKLQPLFAFGFICPVLHSGLS